MAILTVNCGSSTTKVSLFDDHLNRLFEGTRLDSALVEASISSIGHRFVHGGERFQAPLLLDDAVLNELSTMSQFAPLHNQKSLDAIYACRTLFGAHIPQVAVFDTAFHAAMPPVAASYAIEEKLGVKRYGFHGISHAFLWERYAEMVSKEAKIITLHLGNGCSVAAIKNGKSQDTSMGFSPTEGLVMATRAGDIDAAVIPYLVEKNRLTVHEVFDLLNKKSGLLGLSGFTSDMRLLLQAYEENVKARLAVDLFCYRAKKYIGAYTAALEGVDAILFSGGIGENAPFIRKKIVAGFEWLGITLDHHANEQAKALQFGEMRKISTDSSKIAVYVVATDENRYIAKAVKEFFLLIS